MNKNELIQNIRRKKSFLCVGLDTDLKKIPPHLLNDDDPIFAFNRAIIDATAEYAIAYKPNLAFYECAGALVEGEVGFIRNGVFGRGVDDGSVESEDRVVVIQQMRRNLLQIRVKPDAEEGFLAADVLDEFVLIHVAMSF